MMLLITYCPIKSLYRSDPILKGKWPDTEKVSKSAVSEWHTAFLASRISLTTWVIIVADNFSDKVDAMSDKAEAAKCAEIVAFPIGARASLISRCACELETLNGADAVTFWKSECRALAAELSKLGLSEDIVRTEVFAFQDEVQSELMRRSRRTARA